MLGLLAGLSLVAGYLGTLLTQTLTYAASEFDASDTAQGVTLAVVRKVRNLFWTGIGLAIIAAHPVRAGRPTEPDGTAPALRPCMG